MAETSNETVDVLDRLMQILKEEHVFDRSDDQPVVRFLHPEDLRKTMSISLSEEPASEREIDKAIRQTIRYSVRTFSPNFHNQLYGGTDAFGLAGSWLADLLNTSLYTYEVAPVFTLMERELIERSLALVGYPPIPHADGIMCPGGSISNIFAMMMARFYRIRTVKSTGVSDISPLACFTSESSHYSIMKGAHWIGLGTANVHKVKTDEFGRMDVVDLMEAVKSAKKQRHIPFLVVATCGTTVLGAFDPLPDIATICHQEGMWLHVDACLGGTLLLSEKYRQRLNGIELSNSVAWNPHKMLGAPLQCSLFLVKGEKLLQEANCAGALYLFQQDKYYDVSWDMGDKSIQCGRKVDAMKLWLMWKARGTIGLRRSVDQAMFCAEYFLEIIKDTPGFLPVLPSFECCTICFWYIPPSMRHEIRDEGWWNRLYRVTASIKEHMVLEGTVMIGYAPLVEKDVGNFFRMVVTCQPPPTKSSMDYAINQIVKVARHM